MRHTHTHTHTQTHTHTLSLSLSLSHTHIHTSRQVEALWDERDTLRSALDDANRLNAELQVLCVLCDGDGSLLLGHGSLYWYMGLFCHDSRSLLLYKQFCGAPRLYMHIHVYACVCGYAWARVHTQTHQRAHLQNATRLCLCISFCRLNDQVCTSKYL